MARHDESGHLHPDDVPPHDLVRAGHRQKAITGQDAVPGLDRQLGVDGHRPHPAFNFRAKHSLGAVGLSSETPSDDRLSNIVETTYLKPPFILGLN